MFPPGAKVSGFPFGVKEIQAKAIPPQPHPTAGSNDFWHKGFGDSIFPVSFWINNNNKNNFTTRNLKILFYPFLKNMKLLPEIVAIQESHDSGDLWRSK